MSEFEKRMQLADDTLFHEHGTSSPVALRPDPNAAPIPLAHAIVSDETAMEREMVATNQLVYKRIFTISTDEHSPRYSGVTHPLRKGTISFGDTEYQVHDIARDSFGVAIIEGRRYGMLSVQRRDHDGGDY